MMIELAFHSKCTPVSEHHLHASYVHNMLVGQLYRWLGHLMESLKVSNEAKPLSNRSLLLAIPFQTKVIYMYIHV